MSQTAIIYARYSTSEQRGFSIERQDTLGRQFATEQGWIVEKTISDEGKSAFHGANRFDGAALAEFEVEAKGGIHRGKVLVVENIDRLSRQGAKAAALLIWGLNENGVDVATYHDGHSPKATTRQTYGNSRLNPSAGEPDIECHPVINRHMTKTRKPLSEAHKAAISAAQRGAKRSSEFKEKRSQDQKAKWADPEIRERMVSARRKRSL